MDMKNHKTFNMLEGEKGDLKNVFLEHGNF
jgi:hypothetical protein